MADTFVWTPRRARVPRLRFISPAPSQSGMWALAEHARFYRIESLDDEGKQQMKVLVVEDDQTSRRFLETLFSRLGECETACNGREAVDAFRLALQDGRRYDVVCMDIMMPEMDGQEALRQIRALEKE